MALDIISLRHAPELIPRLADWQYQEWGYHSIAELINLLHQCVEGRALPITYVALQDGELAGSIGLYEREMGEAQPPERRFWMGFLFVHPDYRGQGLAKQLMQHMEAHAARFGIADLYLFTTNMAAAYANMGWQVVEQLEFEGEMVTVMVKLLPATEREGQPATTDPTQVQDDSVPPISFVPASVHIRPM
jgi:GNAT superfamily N-acetyltransferase